MFSSVLAIYGQCGPESLACWPIYGPYGPCNMWKMGDISLLGCRVGGLGVRSLPKSTNVMQSFETPRLLLNEALRSLNPPNYLVNIG